ncbi:hypothetical protein EDB89DRAFT_1911780 [Lactarius sanguifluus]|nr:hypothetical protein EDB89DRAFT_1911780 [Lactarius sanguifluus]
MANRMAFIRAVIAILLAACAIAAPGSGVRFGERACNLGTEPTKSRTLSEPPELFYCVVRTIDGRSDSDDLEKNVNYLCSVNFCVRKFLPEAKIISSPASRHTAVKCSFRVRPPHRLLLFDMSVAFDVDLELVIYPGSVSRELRLPDRGFLGLRGVGKRAENAFLRGSCVNVGINQQLGFTFSRGLRAHGPYVVNDSCPFWHNLTITPTFHHQFILHPMANGIAFIRAVVVILLAVCAIAAPGSERHEIKNPKFCEHVAPTSQRLGLSSARHSDQSRTIAQRRQGKGSAKRFLAEKGSRFIEARRSRGIDPHGAQCPAEDGGGVMWRLDGFKSSFSPLFSIEFGHALWAFHQGATIPEAPVTTTRFVHTHNGSCMNVKTEAASKDQPVARYQHRDARFFLEWVMWEHVNMYCICPRILQGMNDRDQRAGARVVRVERQDVETQRRGSKVACITLLWK